MSEARRTVMFLIAGAAVAVTLVLAIVRLPAFGGSHHLYRDFAVAAAVKHHAANVVSSVNFDQRGFDTLGEEIILLASVMGVTVLLRRAEDEEHAATISPGRVLDATSLGGYALLPVTLVLGFDVIAHGHLTPGGGFQAGVILGTGLHLLYVAGRYRALERLRPVALFEYGEALGAAAFACLGISGSFVIGAFLANFIHTGTLGQLWSAGTVPVLNVAVGIEVASGVMVLLAKFFEQAILLRRSESPR
ncbi:MAG: hypothetical protein J2P58_09415 [Acidimicrobiaceae bacterium]|nr:hypothetical protein [Acidimicrobiaceae bacterium]